MEEHPTPRAQVLHGVGVDICMGVLDALYIALLMFPPLLCKDAGILVRFAFVWAEQEEMGLADWVDATTTSDVIVGCITIPLMAWREWLP
jgi:hypothetical protein